MQIFYAPDIKGNTYILDEKESKHLIRVLRMTGGDPVRLIDGKGNLFDGVITKPDVRKCEIEITGSNINFEKRNYYLHIAISPLRNPERLDWFVEKSVEIGIDEITPIICRNSEKSTVKAERLNNIIISAMKQSIKPSLTVLNEPSAFGHFLNYAHQGVKMIAHCNTGYERTGIGQACKAGDKVLILIGPEGDFSDLEIKMATDAGFLPVSLGNSRLRTETAGIAACHSVYFINQQIPLR